MYLIPVFGIAFGLYAMLRDARMRIPRAVEAAWDGVAALAERAARRILPHPDIGGSAPP